ncbi:hypothetical protein [Dyadobacter sediminis]|nr:hypothetical protein [Dyadobacter sediminis]
MKLPTDFSQHPDEEILKYERKKSGSAETASLRKGTQIRTEKMI